MLFQSLTPAPLPIFSRINISWVFLSVSTLTVYLPWDSWNPLLVDLTQMGMQENLLPFSFQQPPTYFRISAMSTLNFLFARLNNPFLSISICLLRLCFPDFWAFVLSSLNNAQLSHFILVIRSPKQDTALSVVKSWCLGVLDKQLWVWNESTCSATWLLSIKQGPFSFSFFFF